MTQYDIYGIGNALVDTEYEVDESFLESVQLRKGLMTLIEDEDRTRIEASLAKERHLAPTKRSGGGSAANTVVTAAQLGSATFYSCKVAADPTGDFFMADLDAAGVATNLTDAREPGATGQCISMVTPDAERTMATHLGITQFLSPSELNRDALARSSMLYIEGYLVSSPTGFEAAQEAQAVAKDAGVEVSLTLSDPAMAEDFKANYELLIDRGVDLLFCNLDEARLMTGADTVDECARALQRMCEKFAITLGGDGALAFDGKTLSRVAGTKAQVVDTTGAGDVFAGAYLHALCAGADCEKALALANRSAGLLVTQFGARLTQADVDTRILANSAQ